jgi:cysteine desulfurase / selenocysteine lyase
MTATEPQTTLSLADARAAFPLATQMTYLDVASRAPMSDHVLAALERYQHVYRTQPLPKYEWLDEVERVRARVARLLHAAPSEVAFVKSTSDGVNQIAHALELATGDEVIVCPEIEHTNNLYPWLHLRDRGVELTMLDASRHAFPLDRLAQTISGRTRVVSLSSTSFVTGARADLRAIADICEEHGAFLMVDGVQDVGSRVLDLPASGVGALAAATQKMLLSSYGFGVLYVRLDEVGRLRPPFLSRMGVVWGDGHEADLSTEYRIADGAARFEVGNPNFAGLFALDGALDLFEAVGLDVIDAHIQRLASRLLEGLDGLGLEVLTPRDAHGAIAVFRPDDVEATAQRLADANVCVAVRRGGVRASVHVFNDDADVDRLLDVLSG